MYFAMMAPNRKEWKRSVFCNDLVHGRSGFSARAAGCTVGGGTGRNAAHRGSRCASPMHLQLQEQSYVCVPATRLLPFSGLIAMRPRCKRSRLQASSQLARSTLHRRYQQSRQARTTHPALLIAFRPRYSGRTSARSDDEAARRGHACPRVKALARPQQRPCVHEPCHSPSDV